MPRGASTTTTSLGIGLMALDVYFQQDVRRNIIAVAVAMLSTSAAHGVTNVEYCRGVLDTSRAQALNHGIPWSDMQADIVAALAGAGVLDALMQRDMIGNGGG